MIRKYLSLVLLVFILNLSVGTVWAKTDPSEKEKQHAEKEKQSVFKLGRGESPLAKIKLHDKTRVENFLGQINDETFVGINKNRGLAVEDAYPNRKQVRGNNLSTKSKILIGVAVVVGVLVVIAAVNGNIGGPNRRLEDAFPPK